MKIRLLLSGAAAGIVCGLFGTGGGMVLVPLLIRFCGVEPRTAFASSLSVTLPMAAVSAAVLWFGGNLETAGCLPFLGGGLLGGLLAGLCYKKIPTSLLRRVMGLLIIWGGIRILWN